MKPSDLPSWREYRDMIVDDLPAYLARHEGRVRKQRARLDFDRRFIAHFGKAALDELRAEAVVRDIWSSALGKLCHSMITEPASGRFEYALRWHRHVRPRAVAGPLPGEPQPELRLNL